MPNGLPRAGTAQAQAEPAHAHASREILSLQELLSRKNMRRALQRLEAAGNIERSKFQREVWCGGMWTSVMIFWNSGSERIESKAGSVPM